MERKEKRISRKRLIQTIVFGTATILVGKAIYDFADSLKPTYVVNGFSTTGTMDNDSVIWQRPTDWRRR